MLRKRFDEVVRYKILAIDDIGTEEALVNFGNKTDVFSEIMDMVEKKSKLVIVTTNLQKKQLEERYGQRIFDRIIATTVRVCFAGKSFRVTLWNGWDEDGITYNEFLKLKIKWEQLNLEVL